MTSPAHPVEPEPPKLSDESDYAPVGVPWPQVAQAVESGERVTAQDLYQEYGVNSWNAQLYYEALLAAEEALRLQREREAKKDAALIEAAEWLESRPDYTEGDAAVASRCRSVLEQ